MPPTFAIVTTKAVPAAAARPDSISVGIDQNGPYAEQCPIGTKARAMIPSTGEARKGQAAKPITIRTKAPATCRRRSFVRSECRLFRSIETIVAAPIADVIQPTPRLLTPVSD